MRTFEGSCHCGALAFAYETALPPARWSVRACRCGFCRAHAALSTSDPAGRLAFHLRHAGRLRRYRFGLMTADFLVCNSCGVYVGAQIHTARGAFGIINTRTLMAVPAELPSAALADYDSEDATERVTRRELKWTPLADLV